MYLQNARKPREFGNLHTERLQSIYTIIKLRLLCNGSGNLWHVIGLLELIGGTPADVL